jgi:hypothetical protein
MLLRDVEPGTVFACMGNEFIRLCDERYVNAVNTANWIAVRLNLDAEVEYVHKLKPLLDFRRQVEEETSNG